MMQARTNLSIWAVLAGATLMVLIVAGIAWSLHHPYGTSWDEAQYLNDAQIDAQRLQHWMLLKLGGRILIKSWGRPPAYRLLALPILGLFGFGATKVRLVSLACFALSSLFIYRASRRVVGPAASALSVLIFCLSPVVAGASIWFGTEGPLYLATSAMMFYLLSIWTEKSTLSRNWIGLGLAVGLGLLSKASFLAIAAPVMVFLLAAGLRRGTGIGSLASETKAALLAGLIALPWWVLNFKAAVETAKEARGFEANSLGSPSLETWARWLNTVCLSLIGYGLCVIIAVILTAWIYQASTKRLVLNRLQQAVLWVCLCAGAPIVLVQLSGTNHLLRHISPAVIPLAIAAGVLADATNLSQSRRFLLIGCPICLGQLLMIVYPVIFPNYSPQQSWYANAALPWQFMGRRDQWDWSPLLTISRDCAVASPRIAYLGVGSEFNPPQMERPWAAAAARTSDETFPFPDVRSLWRYEEGPIDWQKVTRLADQSDIVVTAPSLFGGGRDMDDLSNEQNAELAERLSADPLFRSAVSIPMGRFRTVDVLVFVKKSLSCPSSEPSAAKQLR